MWHVRTRAWLTNKPQPDINLCLGEFLTARQAAEAATWIGWSTGYRTVSERCSKSRDHRHTDVHEEIDGTLGEQIQRAIDASQRRWQVAVDRPMATT